MGYLHSWPWLPASDPQSPRYALRVDQTPSATPCLSLSVPHSILSLRGWPLCLARCWERAPASVVTFSVPSVDHQPALSSVPASRLSQSRCLGIVSSPNEILTWYDSTLTEVISAETESVNPSCPSRNATGPALAPKLHRPALYKLLATSEWPRSERSAQEIITRRDVQRSLVPIG